MCAFLSYNREHKTYNKPKKYNNQATVESVNQGIPYYIGSVEFGYEGRCVPIAGSVSTHRAVDDEGNISGPSGDLECLWVTLKESRRQYNRKYFRESLSDSGVIHQTYSDRLAFLTEEAAKYYSKTGKIL